MRSLFVRKGVTCEAAAACLLEIGVGASTRSIEGKATRGTYSFAFFLQMLAALGADRPKHWDSVISEHADVDEQATHIVLHELRKLRLTPSKAARYLVSISASITPAEFDALIQSGTFQFSLLLQLSSLTAIEGLERYVDHSDVLAAAAEAKHQSSGRK
ncbi:DUF6471 domain-containing protein [Cupriavidus metallidurans]|uniref:DUF6471 domain-containing protein n=1 Tax=Cupriavidus metallidurans TaxID=119219 RepID=UPI001BFCD28E|nr:DUF6471 domain-containing protein [Cupriavidus metallidurans]QWC88820.1 hypothetical protein KB891_01025 [Cupriavidus metallidurans]